MMYRTNIQIFGGSGAVQIKWLLGLSCTAMILWGQAAPINPVAPQSVPSGVRPSPTGSIIHIHSGDDLQAKYNSASCGQDLVLDDGAVFTGSFTFNKQCTAANWILIEGTGCSNGTVPIPTYVTPDSANSATVPPFPAPTLTHYATITNNVTNAPIFFSNGTPAKYNYMGCIEVTGTAQFQYNLIVVSNNGYETLTSQLVDHIMFDRMYVHGAAAQPAIQMQRGWYISGANISIVNSYAYNIYNSSGDSQAILGAFGPGPYLIQNNFLSASTEIIMFGGAGKPPSWTCTIAASPTPTTTSATVNTCIDGAGGSVGTPPIGTQVMFFTSNGTPPYTPADSTTITGNIAGALTFGAIHAAPVSGAGHVTWGITPNDITITQNYLYKPPSWNPSDPSYDGVVRSSKNFVEAKYGKRWNINGNVMVNTWYNGQQFAFNFVAADQNGDCPACATSDIALTNNIVKNISGAFQVITSETGGGNQACPAPLARVLIQNNLFFAQGSAPFIAGGTTFELAGYAFCSVSGGGVDSTQIIHNTMLGAGNNMVLSGGAPYNYTNLVIKDNITEFDQYRWSNVAGGCTEPCLSSQVSTAGLYTASNNAIVNSGAINGVQGVSDATLISRYGSKILPSIYDTTMGMNYAGAPFVNYSAVKTDYHNFALTGSGPWINAASDGTNPGVNFSILDAAIGGSSSLACDLNNDGVVSVLDVQLAVNMSLGTIPCTANINGPGVCAVTTIQRVVNAALGGACVTGP